MSATELRPESVREAQGWSPASWQSHPVLQQPAYRDANALAAAKDELAQLPTIIGAAGGVEKADAIYAALKGRRINGLVTEETTARAVLALAQ